MPTIEGVSVYTPPPPIAPVEGAPAQPPPEEAPPVQQSPQPTPQGSNNPVVEQEIGGSVNIAV
ncbi:MAG: hypothetical protein HY804_07200 [Nitrospinae bacterium]|nr:hypothetical protein [Nitrospinota bacterium]